MDTTNLKYNTVLWLLARRTRGFVRSVMTLVCVPLHTNLCSACRGEGPVPGNKTCNGKLLDCWLSVSLDANRYPLWRSYLFLWTQAPDIRSRSAVASSADTLCVSDFSSDEVEEEGPDDSEVCAITILLGKVFVIKLLFPRRTTRSW